MAWTSWALIALAAGTGPAAQDDRAPVRETAVVEEVRVDRVTLPVSIVGPGCDGLSASDVTVEEDGRPVPRVVAIERDQPPKLHVLLLDTSGSMSAGDHLALAKDAARLYVRGMRPGEKLLLATFDSDLRIRLPLTTIRTERDRERALRTLDAVEARGYTSLRDTLLGLSSYLAGRHERSALVLLSDGVDSASGVPEERLRRYVEGASLEADLAVFPIGLSIPPATPVWKSLRALARTTGGQAFSIDDAGALGETFETIRDLVHGEVTLAYESWPAGRGPRDREREDPLVRRVRVEIPQDARCEAVHHPVRRIVRRRTDAPFDDGLAGPVAWPPPRAPLPGPEAPLPAAAAWPSVTAGLVDDPDETPFLRSADAATISGVFADLRIDAGPLYVGGRRHTTQLTSGVPVFSLSAFDVKLPPFARLVEWIHGPEDVVFELMRLGVSFDRQDDVSLETDVIVSGEAFPWLREDVAERMLRHHPGYSGWAARKIELEKRHAVERLVSAELARLEPDGDGSLDELRQRLVLDLRSGVPQPRAASLAARCVAAEVPLSSLPGARPEPERAATRGRHADLARRIEFGLGEDEAAYLADLALNAERAARLCRDGCSDRVAERLDQLDTLRAWMLRRELSLVGRHEAGRYLGEWLPDVSPRELAFRLERKLANRLVVYGLATGGESRARLAEAWDSLWRRFGGPQGVRSFSVLHPAYRPDLDRIGFYRVTLPVPEPAASVEEPRVWMRGMFPRTPWAFRLVEVLVEAGAVDALGERAFVRRAVHRPLRAERLAEELVRPLDAEIAELDDDWELQRLAAFSRGDDRERAVERLRERRREQRAKRRQRKGVERMLERLIEGDLVEVRVQLSTLPGGVPAPSVFVSAYLPVSEGEPGLSGPVPPACVEVVTATGEPPPDGFGDALTRAGLSECGFLDALLGER